ncbi:hypothetical protein [Pontibacter chinhatensis]|uniref:Uncharacterized protein n=1 Tax=Pontibacter chinhatensis TaxID=1436961 RepID=A0A1I2WNC3_9BACT|nr:hypothetical protein [Pontibacter chinhatensis]SFH02177.1 hypothetical protein SAMN05421739_10597 [Pontibacter chinhatensis]
MITLNKRLSRILLTVAVLLSIPLFGTLFSVGFNWGLFDFILAGGLLLGTGLLCELVLRKVRRPDYRIALIVLVLAALLLIWAEIAVGIFESPLAGS